MQTKLKASCKHCGTDIEFWASNPHSFCSKSCWYSWNTRSPIERFWGYVTKSAPDDCWEWIGTSVPFGYGIFYLTASRGNKARIYAHRFSWEIHNAAEIPPGLFILHRCDNPRCVNPKHLYAGTVLKNAKDKVERGRQQRGSKCYNAKLTEQDVAEMIKLRRTENTLLKDLSSRFGISMSIVSEILSGKVWTHVPR